MPYTVAYAGAGINRHEFEAYIRLLNQHGVDWSNSPRVQDPGTPNRWLYVVQVKTANAVELKEAERFTAQFKVPLEQLDKGPQHLVYAFVVRRNGRWGASQWSLGRICHRSSLDRL